MAKIIIQNPQPSRNFPRRVHMADGFARPTCRYCGAVIYGHNRRACLDCLSAHGKREAAK